MNEELKNAMNFFYNMRATIDESEMLFDEDISIKCGKEMIKQITTILNYIENSIPKKEIKNRKFENEDFEKEFKNWLNNKTEKELVETFKKYSTNNEEI